MIKNIKAAYEKHPKKLLLLPAICVIISLIIIISFYNRTGDIINRDVSLRGGITATVETTQEINLEELESVLAATFGDAEVRRLAEFGTEKQIGVIIEIGETREEELRSILEEELQMELTETNYSTEIVGSSLGESFYQQLMIAMIFAFLLMSIVVFFIFRSFVPSLTVILAAFFDILCTVAIADLFNIKISTAGIAAILMLIGYSVDTDALLTIRTLKRKEGLVVDRIIDAMITSFTMMTTTVVAVLVGYFIATAAALKEVFIIIIIGLIIDVIMTYCMNAPILMLYAKKKEGAAN